jgi:hypothetical protein
LGRHRLLHDRLLHDRLLRRALFGLLHRLVAVGLSGRLLRLRLAGRWRWRCRSLRLWRRVGLHGGSSWLCNMVL